MSMNAYWEWVHNHVDFCLKKAPATYGLSLLFLIFIPLTLIAVIPLMVYFHYRDEKASKPGFMQRAKVK